MHEKVRFIAAVQAQEQSMAELCRQFGISRKTGYKWWQRYRQQSVAGLSDRSRARHTQAQQTGAAAQAALIALKGQHLTWGPKKLVARLHALQAAGQVAADVVIPAPSTAGLVLARHGLVQPRRRRPRPAPPTTPLVAAALPNQLWCVDFKGQFVTADGTWCYPLTISDAASRYLLRCQALTTTTTAVVQPLFAATFREYGLPAAIRTDNGPPFASTGFGGLTPLSVWWLKLGIRVERITPGKPQQNGRHERMHRTLAEDSARPPAASLRAQQRAFDRWRRHYNHERPHEATGLTPPAQHYTASWRPVPARVPDPVDVDADAVRRVRPNGTIRWQGREVHVTQALAGEPVGLHVAGDGQWQLRFASVTLGVLDARQGRLVPVCDLFQIPALPRASPAPTASLSPICPV